MEAAAGIDDAAEMFGSFNLLQEKQRIIKVNRIIKPVPITIVGIRMLAAFVLIDIEELDELEVVAVAFMLAKAELLYGVISTQTGL